jgi:hypothetical protein
MVVYCLPIASKQLQKIFVSYHLPFSLIAFSNYLQTARSGWLTAPNPARLFPLLLLLTPVRFTSNIGLEDCRQMVMTMGRNSLKLSSYHSTVSVSLC